MYIQLFILPGRDWTMENKLIITSFFLNCDLTAAEMHS